MTHLICSARIAIPTDIAQLIVHTQWMFSDVCFFAMLSSIEHVTVTLLTSAPCRRITFSLSLVLHLDFTLTRSLYYYFSQWNKRIDSRTLSPLFSSGPSAWSERPCT